MEGMSILGSTTRHQQLVEVLAKSRVTSTPVRIVGGRGSGRTTLLEEVASARPDAEVVRLRGVADETGLAWAGLDRLLRSLETTTQAPVDLPTASRLVRQMLTANGSRPALVLVDDVDLLDAETDALLATVAEGPSNITVVTTSQAASRVPGPHGAAPTVHLDPLNRVDATRLLLRHAPNLDAVVAEHLVAQIDTNPGTVASLAQVLRQRPPSVAALLGRPAPLQLSSPPEAGSGPAIGAALAAAACGAPEDVVGRALKLMGIEEGSDPAPAAYWATQGAARRRLHACVATAWLQHRPAAPLSLLWHAVHRSWDGPAVMDQTAEILVRAAEDALGTAPPLLLVAGFARAAELTSEPGLRAERAVRAAEVASRAGADEVAAALLKTTNAEDLDRRGRLRRRVLTTDTSGLCLVLLNSVEDGDADGDIRLAQLGVRRALERSEALYADIAARALRMRASWDDGSEAAAVLAAAAELGTDSGKSAMPHARAALIRLLDADDSTVQENLLLARIVAESCWDARLDRRLARRGGKRSNCTVDTADVARLLAAGDYDVAYEAARSELATRPLGRRGPLLANCIEAAIASGRVGEAQALCTELSELAEVIDTAWIRGVALRCRALLCPEGEAVSKLTEALKVLERTGASADVARTHLLLGERLRRQRRRKEALGHLRRAAEVLGLHGHPLELRARREIDVVEAATSPAYSRSLTHQERVVAEMAIVGHSNREIGRSLGISRHTVDHHLRRIYRKLEVAGRDQLRPLVLPE